MAKRKKTPSKLRLVMSIAIWGVLLTAVLGGVIAFVIYRDEIDSAALSRLIPSIKLPGTGETVEADDFTFDPMDDNQFAITPSGGLCVLNNNSLTLSDAADKVTNSTGFMYPTLSVSQRGILAYDRGGTSLFLLDSYKVLMEKTYERPIRSAQINNRGSFVVVAEAAGYKGVAEVFSFNGDLLFRFESGQYLTDAALSPDSTHLVTASFLQQDTRFFSRVNFFDMSSSDTDGYATAEFPDELVLSIHYPNKNYVVVLLETGIEFFKADGTFISRYPFGDKLLLGSSMDGDSFVAVRLGRYRSGVRNEVYFFNFEGEELMRVEFRDSILSMSSKGNYLSVLATGVISMYDSKGVFAGSAEVGDTRLILQNNNGSVIGIGHGKATRVRPE